MAALRQTIEEPYNATAYSLLRQASLAVTAYEAHTARLAPLLAALGGWKVAVAVADDAYNCAPSEALHACERQRDKAASAVLDAYRAYVGEG
jgi:hypothetical protein